MTHTISGDILKGTEPSVTVLRAFYTRIASEAPEYLLDLMEVYCIDGDSITVEKLQVEVISENALRPTLRFTRNGRVLLDDEMTAPSFFELNQQWWIEKATEEHVAARSKRTDRYVELKLRRELQMDVMDWQGPNIGRGAEFVPQGGDYARHLAALGRYLTGLTNGYGDVWVERSFNELATYVRRKTEEDILVEIAGLRDPWKDLEKMIWGQVASGAENVEMVSRERWNNTEEDANVVNSSPDVDIRPDSTDLDEYETDDYANFDVEQDLEGLCED